MEYFSEGNSCQMNTSSLNNWELSGKKNPKPTKQTPGFSSFSMDFKTISRRWDHNADITVYILRLSLPHSGAFLKLGNSTGTQTAVVYVYFYGNWRAVTDGPRHSPCDPHGLAKLMAGLRSTSFMWPAFLCENAVLPFVVLIVEACLHLCVVFLQLIWRSLKYQ